MVAQAAALPSLAVPTWGRYIAEAVAPLVASLVALSGPATEVYISHGRNRQVGGCRKGWAVGSEEQNQGSGAGCVRAVGGCWQQLLCTAFRLMEHPPLAELEFYCSRTLLAGRTACPAALRAHLLPPATARPLQAEPQFLEAAGKHFAIETVGSDKLDEVYQTADVDVLRLRRLGAARASEAAGGLGAGHARWFLVLAGALLTRKGAYCCFLNSL